MPRRASRLLLVSALLGATACGYPSPRAPEVVAKHEAQKRPSLLLADLDLSPKKRKQIDDLVRQLRLDVKDYEEARVALLDEAVIQIKAGKLNEEKLEPLLDIALTKFEAAIPHLIAAMDELHCILNQRERKEFVALLDGDSKKELTEEERQLEKEERLSKVLDLNSGQQTRFFGSLLAITITHYSLVTGTRSGIKEAKKAFVTEEFHAAELRAVKELDLRGLAVITYEALEAAVKILTPQQRQTLAALMVARMR